MRKLLVLPLLMRLPAIETCPPFELFREDGEWRDTCCRQSY